jgi:hypothetical protein
VTCGGANPCTKEGLRAWVDFQRKLPKGVLNRCGSVKIQGVEVGGTREERKGLEYKDLTVRFKMNIYDFETYQDPESLQCKSAPSKP